MDTWKIALIQNKPLRDVGDSLLRLEAMIAEAALTGAALVVLPEICCHPYELVHMRRVAVDVAEQAVLERLREAAREHGIYLCTGSLPTIDGTTEDEGDQVFNRGYLLDPQGEVIMQYDKGHLYDVKFKNLSTRESAVFCAGTTPPPVVDTALGKIGLQICYDIRFPEMARQQALAGADVILVPAAFNKVSGPVHWHLTFRGRAVENQVFMVAVSPACDDEAAYQAYGHSMVVNPWGEVLGEAGAREEIVYAMIDRDRQADIRGRLPLLKHRREELY